MKSENYNKEAMAKAIKFYLDNTGKFLVQESVTSETGFTKPVEIKIEIAKKIVDYMVEEMQLALIADKKIYIPEIGFLEMGVVKKGFKFRNIATGEYERTTENRPKLIGRIGKELFNKIKGI